ncbi:hypothetical protein [Alteromonas macleodii]|jgi:hypoxanthine phosphoribosyltransferase|uniref:Uncharacterized protein n=1 Tax=Alteromonas macleodii (strain English Channel 673) TaxID=1004788 RepID=A0AB32ZYV5_ALTME|nr:hypothetical protein [Alteromonas macleodii]AFT74524.1 hypothetical protein AMEC673_09150 [Alteromonas macleodii str. 'English Channel 673']MBL3809351.1 hypothetical protein [Alteromonas macleodii]MBL3882888.1 hypothetical protein [Alteromonas macleodii]
MTAIQKLFYIPLVTIYILTFVITVLMIGLQIHGGFNINETVLSTLIGASLVESVVAFLFVVKKIDSSEKIEKVNHNGQAIEISEITNDIASMSLKLKNSEFSPDLILCFHRSAAIISGIMSTRGDISVRNLVCLGRESVPTDRGREYQIGKSAELTENVKNKKILVIFFLLDSGGSLKDIEEILALSGIPKGNVRYAALWGSARAKQKFDHVIFGSNKNRSQDDLERLPWITSGYDQH